MTQEDFDRLRRDCDIIRSALSVLVDGGANPSMSGRAAELWSRFNFSQITLAEFNRAAAWFAAESKADGGNSTSIDHELRVLAERALEFNAAAVADFATRRGH